jgi:hypothetical protein
MPDRWPPALEIPRALYDDPAFHAAAPDAYVCALTREVMKNPAVVGRTGRSYERAAIDAWIARHGRDPVATSVKVTREDAAPNRAVRASIERYVARETARRARGAATANEGANEDANEDANETDDEEDDEEDETSDGEGEAKESGGTAVNWRARVETATRETATRETAETRKVRRYLFPRRRVDVVRAEFLVTSVTYPQRADEPDGKFFRFKMEDLTKIVGDWAGEDLEAYKKGEVKDGQGASFVVRRTDKDGNVKGTKTVCVWGGPKGQGVGRWNPAVRAKAGDWAVGDKVTLMNYSEALAMPPRTFPLSIKEYKIHSPTGWNLPANAIRFGQAGLIGHWWKTLDVEFVLDDSNVGTRVYGVHTDAPYETLKFEVQALRSDGRWHKVRLSSKKVPWGRAFKRPVDDATSIRVTWPDTDLHKLPLSAHRSGEGLHANIVGSTTDIDILSVVHPTAGADGKYFRFDPAAMAAARGGARDWEGTYTCYVLRTGVRDKVTFKHGPLGKSASKTLYRHVESDDEDTKPKKSFLATVAGKGRKFIRFGKSRSEIEAGENDDVSEDDDAETGEEVVADDADTNEDVEKEEHELVQALGIGCYSTGARPGDWRVGDVILLKRYVLQPGVVEPSRPAASTRKDGYEEASKTDEWFRVYHPDPIEPNQVDEVVIPDT